MAVVNKFNVNREQVRLDADIIENMSANDVSYNDSFQYDENTVGNKLSELEKNIHAESVEIVNEKYPFVFGTINYNNGAVTTEGIMAYMFTEEFIPVTNTTKFEGVLKSNPYIATVAMYDADKRFKRSIHTNSYDMSKFIKADDVSYIRLNVSAMSSSGIAEIIKKRSYLRQRCF